MRHPELTDEEFIVLCVISYNSETGNLSPLPDIARVTKLPFEVVRSAIFRLSDFGFVEWSILKRK